VTVDTVEQSSSAARMITNRGIANVQRWQAAKAETLGLHKVHRMLTLLKFRC
jgi:ribosomal protein L30/L7E